jgi:DNA-binding Lrp family transcriptional regulator
MLNFLTMRPSPSSSSLGRSTVDLVSACRDRSASGMPSPDAVTHLADCPTGFLWVESRLMDPLLKLLTDDATLKPEQLAAMLNLSEPEVLARIKQLRADHSILGYRAVLNEEKLGVDLVRAVIEVKITPERGGGFDRLAERIAKFEEVVSCYLMSGAYDLLVVVEGEDLRQVARFVAEKLASLQGVLSTATHFMLRPYKEQGIPMVPEKHQERLAVTP